MLKFKVSIGYREFIFDDGGNAMAFAQVAKMHYHDDDNKSINVEIELIEVNDADEAEVCENKED